MKKSPSAAEPDSEYRDSVTLWCPSITCSTLVKVSKIHEDDGITGFVGVCPTCGIELTVAAPRK